MTIKVHTYENKEDIYLGDIEFNHCLDIGQLIIVGEKRYRIVGKWFEVENDIASTCISIELENNDDKMLMTYK